MNYYINNIDLFGQKLSFTLFQEDKFKTLFGSLLSILIIVLGIMFFILFGSDLFYKENPLINYQTVIQSNYTGYPLKAENFLIPWGIFDINGKVINTTGYIYPQIIYNSFVLGESGEFETNMSITLNYTYCDKKYEKIIPGVSNYFCTDFDSLNLTFGGGFDGTFVDYFYLSINYCPKGNRYSPDTGCPTLDQLNGFLNQDELVYLQLFYPSLNFQGNKENPLTIEYLQYYYQLSMPLNKINRFYFQQSVLLDDDGVILKNNKSSQTYYLNKINTDYTIFPTEFYDSTKTRTRIYSGYFYMTKNFDLHNRSYMKFQTLTATVGGFLNIIFIICAGLNKMFNTTFRNRKLFNEIFDFYEYDGSKKVQLSNYTMTQNFMLRSINEERKSENPHEVRASKTIFEKQTGTQLKKFVNLDEIKNEYSLFKLTSVNILPSHFSILKYKYFGEKFFGSNKGSILMKAFEIGLTNIKKRLDIIYYLKTVDVIDKIRTLILNKEQNFALDFINKENLLDSQIQKKLEDTRNSKEKELLVAEYFKTKISNNNMDRMDKELLSYLDIPLQTVILKKE